MMEEIVQLRPSMPRKLKVVRGLVWFQAVANAAAGVLLVVDAIGRNNHGQKVDGMGTTVAFVSFVVSAILVACALRASHRSPWVRTVIVIMEVLTALGGAILLFSGGWGAVLGIGMALWMILAVNSLQGLEWFGR
jgi:hypothetical protein